MTNPLPTLPSRFHSLGFRWVILVAVAASLGVAVMLLLTRHEMEKRLDQQGEAVTVLAQQKAVQRLDVAIKLVEQRLRGTLSSLEDELAAFAASPAAQEILRSRNDVRISNVLGSRLRNAGFSGGMVVDHQLAVVGTDKPGGQLTAVQAALASHDLGAIFRELIDNNDRRRPSPYRFSGVLDASHAGIFLAPLQDKYGSIFAYPIFDPFGDAIGLVVAYRTLRKTELTLRKYAETTSSAVLLMQGTEIISAAGISGNDVALSQPDSAGLLHMQGQQMVGRCAITLPKLTTCVLRSSDEITTFRQEVLAIGIAGSQATSRKLAILAIFSVVVVSVLLAFLSRRLTRPLSEITDAVDRVAKGEWRVEVQHAERSDEIGMIARAVAGMQISLIERDRMRQEMVRIDAINQRRLLMDKALNRFETGLTTVMQSIAGTLTLLDQKNAQLGHAAAEAEAQASRILSSTEETASNATIVSVQTVQVV